MFQKEKTFLLLLLLLPVLAIFPQQRPPYSAWVFWFVSAEVRKKRKVQGRCGAGGRGPGPVTNFSPSLWKPAEARASGFFLPLTPFRGHEGPGASVSVALLLPASSRTPLGCRAQLRGPSELRRRCQVLKAPRGAVAAERWVLFPYSAGLVSSELELQGGLAGTKLRAVNGPRCGKSLAFNR